MNIKMRIKQWLWDFLHPIVWNDLGLRVIKRELDDTWQVTQNLRKKIQKLKKQKEIEQEFFRVFGIEPKKLFSARQGINPDAVIYPEITAEKLLEMICILNDYEGIDVQGTTMEELKEELLNQCIEYFKYPIAFEENADLCNLHNKIQQLFKEQTNE